MRYADTIFYEEVERAWLDAHSKFFYNLMKELNLKEVIKSEAEKGATYLTLGATNLKKFAGKDAYFSEKFFNELTVERMKYFLGRKFDIKLEERSFLLTTHKSIIIKWR